MNGPAHGNVPSETEEIACSDRYEVVYRGNLIYLPFACHLADIDEEAEQDLKAA